MPTPYEIMNKVNATLAKKYKRNAPVLNTADELPPVDWISTGLLAYDYVNGGGGAIGHLEQIYGRRSSGKTSLVLKRIGTAQREGKTCAFIDVEHTLDESWARRLGVNLDELILHIPEPGETGEMTLTIVQELLKSQGVDLLVLDSVSAITPKSQLESSLEDKHYGGNSGLLSQFFNQIIPSGILQSSGTCLIFINQPRPVIGSRIPMERLPGGRALSHYSSIISEVRRGDIITTKNAFGEDEAVGIEVKLINKKNKVRRPFRDQTMRLNFENGFNPLYDVLLFAKRYELITLKGAWGYFGDEQMGQGVENHMQWLIENPEKYFEIKDRILEIIREE